MTTVFLIFTLALNVLFLLYSKWLIQVIKAKEQDMQDMSSLIDYYVSHVKSVHEMEMFYGDKTLATLIEHGNQLIETIEQSDFIIIPTNLQEDKNDEQQKTN